MTRFHLRVSTYRIALRAGILSVALLIAFVLWYLPNFSNLDAFRPEIIDLLEKNFHCRVLLGNVHAELVPLPGLSLRQVTLVDPAEKSRVLASAQSVHLWISIRTLLTGRPRISAIRFWKPRFILHRHARGWSMLLLPEVESPGAMPQISDVEIRSGAFEIWDHTTGGKWVFDRLFGGFKIQPQTGKLSGQTASLGKRCFINLQYNGAASPPVTVRVENISLASAVKSILHMDIPLHDIPGQCLLTVRTTPGLQIETVFSQPGGGSFTASAKPGNRGRWAWTGNGKNFGIAGTAIKVLDFSAEGNPFSASATAHAATEEGGLAHIQWSQASDGRENLSVTVSSVTIRQILEIFDLQSTPNVNPHPPHAGEASVEFHPYAYESWRIESGTVTAKMQGITFTVSSGNFDLAGMHMDLTGEFSGGSSPSARIAGDIQHIPVDRIAADFYGSPPPITGTGKIYYSLSFPLKGQWVTGLNGPIQMGIDDGVLRMFKTIYRIFSVLNLSNYLTLRIPQVQAKGVEFGKCSGNLTFQNGILSTDDLFLKSPNMNLGVKGSLDIPKENIRAVVRLELFRFLEDVLKYTPVTHWLFKRPNKIFLPLVVSVKGPWNDVEIR
jgi:uncharacterized protein YhdP